MEGFKWQARSLNWKAGEQWETTAEMNLAVEKFLWQTRLGMED